MFFVPGQPSGTVSFDQWVQWKRYYPRRRKDPIVPTAGRELHGLYRSSGSSLNGRDLVSRRSIIVLKKKANFLLYYGRIKLHLASIFKNWQSKCSKNLSHLEKHFFLNIVLSKIITFVLYTRLIRRCSRIRLFIATRRKQRITSPTRGKVNVADQERHKL